MARKSLGISTADSPPVTTDDLILIKGIGSILAKRLHKAGIYSYNQLAVLSPDALAEKVSGLSAKHITRQDWIGQARALLTAAPEAAAPETK